MLFLVNRWRENIIVSKLSSLASIDLLQWRREVFQRTAFPANMILSLILDVAWFQFTNLWLNNIRTWVSIYREQCLFINTYIPAEPIHNLLKFDDLPNLLFLLHQLGHWRFCIGRLLSIRIHHILRVMQRYEVVQRGAVAFLTMSSRRRVYQLQQLVSSFFSRANTWYRRKFDLYVLDSSYNRLEFVVFYPVEWLQDLKLLVLLTIFRL